MASILRILALPAACSVLIEALQHSPHLGRVASVEALLNTGLRAGVTPMLAGFRPGGRCARCGPSAQLLSTVTIGPELDGRLARIASGQHLDALHSGGLSTASRSGKEARVARETFISYKYSDAVQTRDAILEALGDDARYYRGENGTSPDRTDSKTESIKSALRDMIHQTSVTIVVCSPEMTQSSWIGWEIAYSLRETSRAGRFSRRNGIVGVVQESAGSYGWLRPSYKQQDGHTSTSTNDYLLQDIIPANRFNQIPPEYVCDNCKTITQLGGSYVSLVNESDFLSNPDLYVENAYSKSTNLKNYDIRIDV